MNQHDDFFLAPFVSLIMYFIKPYNMMKNEQDDNQEDHEESNESNKSCKLFDDQRIAPRLRRFIKILLALWFTFYVLSETMFFKFAITYYQYCSHQLSVQDAASLYSYSIIAYTVTRVFDVIVSTRLNINIILHVHYVILVIGMLLMIGAHFNELLLWVSGPVLMAGFAPMFAGTYAFAARYAT